MLDGLYRSRRDRVIGGVAGGMAESLRIDPTIARVGWVVLALLTNGLLVLVYFVLLFVVPDAPDDAREAGAPAPIGGATTRASSTTRATRASVDGRSGTLFVGASLVLVGGFFVVRRFLPSFDLAASWPIIAVGLGIVLIVAALRSGGRSR